MHMCVYTHTHIHIHAYKCVYAIWIPDSEVCDSRYTHVHVSHIGVLLTKTGTYVMYVSPYKHALCIYSNIVVWVNICFICMGTHMLYMCIYTHTYLYTCVRTRTPIVSYQKSTHVYSRQVCRYVHIFTLHGMCENTYMHTYQHTYVYTRTHVVHYKQRYTHAVYVHIHAYLHTYTQMHVCVHIASLPVEYTCVEYAHTYLDTYVCGYIWTHMYVGIYIHIF